MGYLAGDRRTRSKVSVLDRLRASGRPNGVAAGDLELLAAIFDDRVHVVSGALRPADETAWGESPAILPVRPGQPPGVCAVTRRAALCNVLCVPGFSVS